LYSKTRSNLIRKETAHLPTKHGDFSIQAYIRSENAEMPHLALSHKKLNVEQAVVVRIHSECLTGDLFASKRCDCGEQLERSMRIIAEEEGVLIYLRQEGRGIGILNKLRAYNHQDEGMNTIEANEALGFMPDERNYSVALHILEDLGIKKIRLLTNNPEKLSAFENSNIEVVEHLPLVVVPNETNQAYLETKESKMGHIFKNS